MIKQLLRAAVPQQRWQYVSWTRDRFGTAPALAVLAQLTWSGSPTARVATPSGGTVTIRPGTADMTVFDEIFVHRCYEQTFAEPPQVIVDAGAHIGLATVYYAERYPEATIVSLEPEPANYALLVENTRRFPRVKPVAAALWGRDTNMAVTNPGAETWSYQFNEGDGGVAGYSLATLMRQFALDRIDLLKIDIEGSEVEVFQDASSWIHSVKAMLVELHDRHRPGCSDALRSAIAAEGFIEAPIGDCVMCSRPGTLVGP